MQNSKLFKIITLCCFAVFISSFVAYRSGAFNKHDKNDTMANKTYNSGGELAVDSPPVKKVIMPGSKSGWIIEQEEISQVKKDSIKKPQNTGTPPTIMGSSKSAGIFHPNDFKHQANQPTQTNQALQKDTLKKQQNNLKRK
jgi:hypothetical protein